MKPSRILLGPSRSDFDHLMTGFHASDVVCTLSRIIAWKDRVTPDNFAVNSEEPEYYRRSAGGTSFTLSCHVKCLTCLALD